MYAPVPLVKIKTFSGENPSIKIKKDNFVKMKSNPCSRYNDVFSH